MVGTTLLLEIGSKAESLGYHALIVCIAPQNQASVRLHGKLELVYFGKFRGAGSNFARWQDIPFYQLVLPSKTEIGKS